MTEAPKLTDTDALLRHRARAAAFAEPAYFMHDLAIGEVKETLEMVNKSFESPALVCGHPDPWVKSFPGFKVASDSDALDLDERAFDLVVHAMSLHWANDPVGQMIQSRRALKPDGLFVAIAFGGQSLHELRSALTEAETSVTGGVSPRVLPMGDVRDYGNLLQRSGFAMPVANVIPQEVKYRDILHLMRDLRAMGETNALARRHKAPISREILMLAQHIYSQNFSSEVGGIRATFELVQMTGWAPDDSQPKPLRPGSAKARLSDALGAVERPLTDR